MPTVEAFSYLSGLYYPFRRKVTIDGCDASMLKVNGLLRGVADGCGESGWQAGSEGFLIAIGWYCISVKVLFLPVYIISRYACIFCVRNIRKLKG